MPYARHYQIYLPLNHNDGARIEPERINAVRDRLADKFGGATVSALSAPYQGPWKYGGVEYVDNIITIEVVAEDDEESRKYFANLKSQLERELDQVAILITTHSIEVV